MNTVRVTRKPALPHQAVREAVNVTPASLATYGIRPELTAEQNALRRATRLTTLKIGLCYGW